MAGLAPVELTTSCSECGLEGGCVEIYDALVAACRFGLPATTRCKLCDAATEGSLDRPAAKELREIPANRCPACLGVLDPRAIDDRACAACGVRATLRATRAASRFAAIADFERALDAWAEREGWPSRSALAVATFADPDVAELFACLGRGEPLEIIADPFANMGIRTTGGSGKGAAAKPRSTARPPASALGMPSALAVPPTKPSRHANAPPSTPPAHAHAGTEPLAAPMLALQTAPAPVPELIIAHSTTPPPPSAPPRAIVYPLVSVITADGEIHPEEQALIDRFLQSEGLAPLGREELRVHHPSEVAHLVPKERREDVVKLMCESAAVDGMPDESERRVIRAYANAWGVDDEKIEFWMWGYETMNTSLARQLFLKLRRFVLSARWSDPDPE